MYTWNVSNVLKLYLIFFLIDDSTFGAVYIPKAAGSNMLRKKLENFILLYLIGLTLN